MSRLVSMPARALLLVLVGGVLLSAWACHPGPHEVQVTPTPTPHPVTTPGDELPLMYRLITGTDIPAVMEEMGDSGNPAYMFALVEAMRFNYWPQQANQALEKLSGQSPGADWEAWARWLWRQDDISPPLGFDGWKGKFIRRFAKANYKYLLYNGLKSRIEVEQIVWSGLSWEDIPPLDHPDSIPASAVAYLQDEERVFGASIDGESRAYPLRILERHQAVNDVLGGRQVLVTYCPLSGSGIMYERPVEGGEVFFKASGLLYRNNTLLYDGAWTLWDQFSGQRVTRRDTDEEMTLTPLPMVATMWTAWRALHPDTTVLEMPTGYFQEYSPGWVYDEYIASPDVMFPLLTDDDRLEDKEMAFGLTHEGTTRVYRLEDLLARLVVNDTIGDLEVALFFDTAGGGVRVYQREGHAFQPAGAVEDTARGESDTRLLVKDGSGQAWRVDEGALVNLSNPAERLDRVPGRLAYWFVWYSFYPNVEVYGGE